MTSQALFHLCRPKGAIRRRRRFPHAAVTRRTIQPGNLHVATVGKINVGRETQKLVPVQVASLGSDPTQLGFFRRAAERLGMTGHAGFEVGEGRVGGAFHPRVTIGAGNPAAYMFRVIEGDGLRAGPRGSQPRENHRA